MRDFLLRGRSTNGGDCDRKDTSSDNSDADISERPVASQRCLPNWFPTGQSSHHCVNFATVASLLLHVVFRNLNILF
jgi:hypothetical protein